MLKFTKYGENKDSNLVLIAPEEIAVVQPWKYHSFREAISEIVLRCGTRIKVWEPVDEVYKRIELALVGKSNV